MSVDLLNNFFNLCLHARFVASTQDCFQVVAIDLTSSTAVEHLEGCVHSLFVVQKLLTEGTCDKLRVVDVTTSINVYIRE
jgi:hypothetical protein